MTANRERRRFTDRRDLVLSLASIVLSIAMFLWVHSQGNDLSAAQQKIAAQQQALKQAHSELGVTHDTLVNSCNRLNRQYVEENRTAFSQFELFGLVFSETKASLSRPPRPVTSQQRQQTVAFLKRLDNTVKNEAWTPLANCDQQVSLHGGAYRVPDPVLFTRRLPSAAALTPPHLTAHTKLPTAPPTVPRGFRALHGLN